MGGIDCTESAAAAGDEYPTGPIVAVEGFATLIGGLFGGVIQSTPYIGHPAYKAMGARAAYTLATGLFVGGAGILGYFDWIFFLLPKAVVFPILIFVGLEMTAQSFLATPRRHYPAVALACVPALAYLAILALKQVLPGEMDISGLRLPAQRWVQTVLILSNGFIVTSLLWATMLAHLIDGKVRSAVMCLVIGGSLALFGVIHSPLPSSPIVIPSEAIRLPQNAGQIRCVRGPIALSLGCGLWNGGSGDRSHRSIRSDNRGRPKLGTSCQGISGGLRGRAGILESFRMGLLPRAKVEFLNCREATI